MRRIFLSGPVGSKKYYEAAEAFRRAEMWVYDNLLRKDEVATIINPMAVVPGCVSDPEAMEILMPLLCKCDTIVLLPDHAFSEGSKIEESLARYLRLQIIKMES